MQLQACSIGTELLTAMLAWQHIRDLEKPCRKEDEGQGSKEEGDHICRDQENIKLPLKKHSSNFNTSYRPSKKSRDKLEKQHAL